MSLLYSWTSVSSHVSSRPIRTARGAALAVRIQTIRICIYSVNTEVQESYMIKSPSQRSQSYCSYTDHCHLHRSDRKETEQAEYSKVPVDVINLVAAILATCHLHGSDRKETEQAVCSKVPVDVINLAVILAMMQKRARRKGNRGSLAKHTRVSYIKASRPARRINHNPTQPQFDSTTLTSSASASACLFRLLTPCSSLLSPLLRPQPPPWHPQSSPAARPSLCQ